MENLYWVYTFKHFENFRETIQLMQKEVHIWNIIDFFSWFLSFRSWGRVGLHREKDKRSDDHDKRRYQRYWFSLFLFSLLYTMPLFICLYYFNWVINKEGSGFIQFCFLLPPTKLSIRIYNNGMWGPSRG